MLQDPSNAGRRRNNPFVRNWSLLVVSGVLCQVLGVIATFRIARVLAPNGYGQYNLVLATAGVGVVVAALGLRNVITRSCARNPAESGTLLIVAAGLRAIGLVVSAGGIAVFERSLGGTLSLSFTLTVLLLLGGMNLWDSVESVAWGHEQMQYSAAINLGGNIVWILVAWTVPAAWLVPLTVSVAFAALQFGEAILYIGIAARRGWLRASWRSRDAMRRMARMLVREGAPFWWLELLTTATGQIPILVLGAASGVAQVGLFNAGYRLVGPLTLLISSALASLYPGLSRLGSESHERFVAMVGRALVVIAVLGTGGALAISLLRAELVAVIFSRAFAGAADVIAVQCWYAVLLALLSLIGTSLAAIDRQRLIAGLSTCYAAIGLPIIWIGAHRGAHGLAIALLTSALLSLTYHWVFFVRALPAPISRGAVLTPLLLVAAGMTLSWLVPPTMPLVVRVGIVGLVGIVICFGAIVGVVRRPQPTLQPLGAPR